MVAVLQQIDQKHLPSTPILVPNTSFGRVSIGRPAKFCENQVSIILRQNPVYAASPPTRITA
jgi:hypothetical protein